MTGCQHNAERTLVWPEPQGRIDAITGARAYLDGQLILLTCPHGCPAVTWALRGCHPETHSRPSVPPAPPDP